MHTPKLDKVNLMFGTCGECGKNLPDTVQWGATDQGFGLCKEHILAYADALSPVRAAAPKLLEKLESIAEHGDRGSRTVAREAIAEAKGE